MIVPTGLNGQETKSTTPRQPTDHELEIRFTYHLPRPDQTRRYEDLRRKAHELAMIMNGYCPPSREYSLALTHLEEAVFWANAAIARRSKA
jgi:hypothetical protein